MVNTRTPKSQAVSTTHGNLYKQSWRKMKNKRGAKDKKSSNSESDGSTSSSSSNSQRRKRKKSKKNKKKKGKQRNQNALGIIINSFKPGLSW